MGERLGVLSYVPTSGRWLRAPASIKTGTPCACWVDVSLPCPERGLLGPSVCPPAGVCTTASGSADGTAPWQAPWCWEAGERRGGPAWNTTGRAWPSPGGRQHHVPGRTCGCRDSGPRGRGASSTRGSRCPRPRTATLQGLAPELGTQRGCTSGGARTALLQTLPEDECGAAGLADGAGPWG